MFVKCFIALVPGQIIENNVYNNKLGKLTKSKSFFLTPIVLVSVAANRFSLNI
jgi:hypothetical protein